MEELALYSALKNWLSGLDNTIETNLDAYNMTDKNTISFRISGGASPVVDNKDNKPLWYSGRVQLIHNGGDDDNDYMKARKLKSKIRIGLLLLSNKKLNQTHVVINDDGELDEYKEGIDSKLVDVFIGKVTMIQEPTFIRNSQSIGVYTYNYLIDFGIII